MVTAILFDGTSTEPKDLSGLIHQAVGAGSVCWESMSGTGVFQDDRARAIAEEAIAWIEKEYGPTEPRLGLATTAQLLDEVRTRIMIDGYNGGGGLQYRTVDGS